MTTVLRLRNTRFSFRQRMQFTDAAGTAVVEATRQLFSWRPTVQLKALAAGRVVTTIRKRWFAWADAFDVDDDLLGRFVVRRPRFAWRRRYRVDGGPFDGARLAGSAFDLTFALGDHRGALARARGRVLTLRDTHEIEILRAEPAAERFVAIMLVIVQVARRMEREESAARVARQG
jgi:uncharacterized protein YxjI